MRPTKGAALAWENYDAHGHEDPRTVHMGVAPVHGDKYVLNVWIRTAPFAAFAGADTSVPR